MIYCKTPRSKNKRKPGWREEELKYQKHLASLGIKPNSKQPTVKFKEYAPSYNHRSANEQITSITTTAVSGLKKDSPKYTGDLIKGIAIMHKSCLQPIISKEQAIESASMRR